MLIEGATSNDNNKEKRYCLSRDLEDKHESRMHTLSYPNTQGIPNAGYSFGNKSSTKKDPLLIRNQK